MTEIEIENEKKEEKQNVEEQKIEENLDLDNKDETQKKNKQQLKKRRIKKENKEKLIKRFGKNLALFSLSIGKKLGKEATRFGSIKAKEILERRKRIFNEYRKAYENEYFKLLRKKAKERARTNFFMFYRQNKHKPKFVLQIEENLKKKKMFR